MMKTADTRQSHDFTRWRRARLNRPASRGRLFQSDVSSLIVIIGQIIAPQPTQMLFIEGNDVIEYLASNTADPALGDSVLPWAPSTRANRLDAARLEELEHTPTELCITNELKNWSQIPGHRGNEGSM